MLGALGVMRGGGAGGTSEDYPFLLFEATSILALDFHTLSKIPSNCKGSCGTFPGRYYFGIGQMPACVTTVCQWNYARPEVTNSAGCEGVMTQYH